jgi:two-component system, response regulator
LNLPKLNGLEVLQRLRNDPRTRRVSVVILTSSSEHDDLVDSYELGANSFVSKPVGFDQFQSVITQLGTYWSSTNTPSPIAKP